MAKENQEEPRTSVDKINDTLSGIEQKVQNNSRPFIWGIVIVIAIVCAILFYFYGIRQPGINKANEAIGAADIEMTLGNDSVALVKYKDVADNYGYQAGNRAALNAAIILYKQGKYQEALDYLKKYNGKDKIIAASAKSLEGDCLVNLKKYDQALSCFAEAAKISDDNPAYTPAFLMKEATVCRELKNYNKEAELYQQIIDQYPNYGPSLNIDMEKYLERAKIDAGQK